MVKALTRIFPPLPGTDEITPPPLETFEKIRAKRGPSYHPRTRHHQGDGWASYTNRLFLETSPYLLQHAHNPVNWFPWCDEAFALAEKLHRPILVSIGYATCHWCHVMEEESFEDEEIARFLNENFIAVKVDREERPDIDSVYMSAVQAMNSQGGWPLNVWLTPDRRPFYGGTYFPPRDHSRGIGFLTLLKMVREAYLHEPAKVEEAGAQLTSAVARLLVPPAGDTAPGVEAENRLMQLYKERFDPIYGSLLGAPKFPSTLPLSLLYRHYLASGDSEVLGMALLTLKRMAGGGIYDQVAGGFHRYATDQTWLVPHFEKMLYDNALLAVAYLEGYQLSGEADFSRVVREILRYLQRDLGAPDGAFFGASDADSLTPSGKREEGYFFTWTVPELREKLGPELAGTVAACFGVSAAGNFEGRNILHLPRPLHEVAAELGRSETELRCAIEEAKELLYRIREERPKPLRDEKILCSWNGLALSAFAKAGFVLNDADALAQARRTARFLLEHLWDGKRLAHSYQEGEAKGEGFLEDYAFLMTGLLDLFEATGEPQWLQGALELERVLSRDFADPQSGGFFLTGAEHERLIARQKPAYDGALPSGNSRMVSNLFRLYGLTGETRFKRDAERSLAAFSGVIARAPAAASEMLSALHHLLEPSLQVVIVTPEGKREAGEALLDRLRDTFLPQLCLIALSEGEELAQAQRLSSLLADRRAAGDRAVAYLCREGRCLLPTSDPAELAQKLREGGGDRRLAER